MYLKNVNIFEKKKKKEYVCVTVLIILVYKVLCSLGFESCHTINI